MTFLILKTKAHSGYSCLPLCQGEKGDLGLMGLPGSRGPIGPRVKFYICCLVIFSEFCFIVFHACYKSLILGLTWV